MPCASSSASGTRTRWLRALARLNVARYAEPATTLMASCSPRACAWCSRSGDRFCTALSIAPLPNCSGRACSTVLASSSVLPRCSRARRRCVRSQSPSSIRARWSGAARSANTHVRPGPITASQKPIEDRCPSPISRRETTTRSCPARRADWSGCATTLGLQTQAPSGATSALNTAPSAMPRLSSGGKSRSGRMVRACRRRSSSRCGWRVP